MVPAPAKVKHLPPLQLVIFGVQGSGKGTQAEMLTRRFGPVHIATGEIFRQEIARQTALGARAQRYLRRGQLVPDAVTNAIVRRRLRQPRVRRHGFVLDGYPRSLDQLAALQQLTPLPYAIEITSPDREAVRRIGGRRTCGCGMIYHVRNNPPQRPGVCDRCGGKLYVRDDDRPAAIWRRIRTYHRQTKPLLAAFRRQGRLITVDGRPTIEKVFAAIRMQLRRHRLIP